MTVLLYLCAVTQAFVAALNLCLPSLLGWRPALAGLPTLVREVFHVHAFFLSLTLLGFALFTFVFAEDIAGVDPQATAIAGFIGMFWALRVVIQLVYYSREHHRGRPLETGIHYTLLGVYGGISGVYFAAALI